MGSVFTCKLNPCCGDRRNCDPPRQYNSEPDPTHYVYFNGSVAAPRSKPATEDDQR